MRWTSREGLQLLPEGHPKGIFASQKLPAVHPSAFWHSLDDLTQAPLQALQRWENCHVQSVSPLYAIVCHCMPLSNIFLPARLAWSVQYRQAGWPDHPQREANFVQSCPLQSSLSGTLQLCIDSDLRSQDLEKQDKGTSHPSWSTKNMFSFTCSPCLITVRKVFGVTHTDFLATRH